MHEMLHNLQTLLNRFNKKCSHKLPGLKVQGCSGRCTGTVAMKTGVPF
jgi:hypothetical protein